MSYVYVHTQCFVSSFQWYYVYSVCNIEYMNCYMLYLNNFQLYQVQTHNQPELEPSGPYEMHEYNTLPIGTSTKGAATRRIIIQSCQQFSSLPRHVFNNCFNNISLTHTLSQSHDLSRLVAAWTSRLRYAVPYLCCVSTNVHCVGLLAVHAYSCKGLFVELELSFLRSSARSRLEILSSYLAAAGAWLRQLCKYGGQAIEKFGKDMENSSEVQLINL